MEWIPGNIDITVENSYTAVVMKKGGIL